LALAAGGDAILDVSAFLARMPREQWDEWEAANLLEPVGWPSDERRFGILAMLLHNGLFTGDGKRAGGFEHAPFAEPIIRSPEELKAKMLSIAAAHNRRQAGR